MVFVKRLVHSIKNSKYTMLLVPFLVLVSLLFVTNIAIQQKNNPKADAATNPIVKENQKPGTQKFLTKNIQKNTVSAQEDYSSTVLAATEFTQPDINGYASAASINKGENIKFFVSTTAPSYDIEIYRMGWYNGVGSSLKQTVSGLPGQFQQTPTPDPLTGLVDANWQVSHTLQTDVDWTTGVYLAKLIPSAGDSGYIIFVVRDDGAPSDILYQLPVSNYQAYNFWGGESLYDSNSTTRPRAFKVSYNRPYNDWNGAGLFFDGDYNMIRYLESQGYNISYATSVDVHTTPSLLNNRKVFVSNWHDEYWSKPMRDNLTAWRDQGKHLAFFDANNIYWQIRFENDSNGNPNRTQVCYKVGSGGVGVDPMTLINEELTTTQWRQLTPVKKPENQLLGGMYQDGIAAEHAWVVQNAWHWIYAGTGLNNGNSIPGLVGKEYDKVWDNGWTPSGTITLSNSPVTSYSFGTSYANGTIYKAASGAYVFNAGTFIWPWKLDDNTYQSHGADARVQQMTKNILGVMTGAITPPASYTYNAVATEDTFVDSSSSTPKPNATSLLVKYSPKKIIYLKFNLAPLAGKTIDNIELKLNNGDKYSASVKPTVRLVGDSTWNEATMIYSNKKSLGSTLGYLSSPGPFSWTYTNLTNITNALQNMPRTHVTIALELTSTATELNFSSSESAAPPVLIIQYH